MSDLLNKNKPSDTRLASLPLDGYPSEPVNAIHKIRLLDSPWNLIYIRVICFKYDYDAAHASKKHASHNSKMPT